MVWLSSHFAYDELKNYKEAIKNYDKAIELYPEFADAYNKRGSTYMELDNYKDAFEDFNKAIELDPLFAGPYNNRGSVYRKQQNYVPAGETECTPITTTNQPEADNSATSNNDSGKSCTGQGDLPNSPDPVSPERSQVLPAVTPKFVLTASPELKSYIHTASPNWAQIVEAANTLRDHLGISRPAWIDACQAMGRYQAATAVAVITAKGETIRSPGGYLRGMTDRAQKGELHLSNSLWGLARRERPQGTYDA